MDRYEEMFAAARARGEAALIPYLVVGDPSPEEFLELVEVAVRSGADALELGIAFSDPLADGPTVQEAAQRVLASGLTVEAALALIGRVRASHPALPIGLLVYANVAHGIPRFARKCVEAGVDSVLVPDRPLEEDGSDRFDGTGIARVYIVPPNADEELVARVAETSRGYVYVTSRAGVTGTGVRLARDGAAHLPALAAHGSAPPVLGFGISLPEHIAAAARAGFAGAIVGSALIEVIAANLGDPEGMRAQVGALLGEMKAATVAGGAPADA